MPTYGYECTACNDQFEIFQSIKDPALTTCESCGGALRKRIYPVGIAFKGSGFYVNDYAAKSAAAAPSAGDAAKPAENSKPADAKTEAPKTETAPAAAAAPAPTAAA